MKLYRVLGEAAVLEPKCGQRSFAGRGHAAVEALVKAGADLELKTKASGWGCDEGEDDGGG